MKGRKSKLVCIKLIHILIWFIFVTIIAFVAWSDFTSNISRYSWLAVVAIVLEGIVLLMFGGSCLLTKIAGNHSVSQNDNFDIYLPNWLDRHNKLIFTSLFLIGVLLLFRHFKLF